jgi:hypothetical protein
MFLLLMQTDAGIIESPFPTILVLLHSGELYMVASSGFLVGNFQYFTVPIDLNTCLVWSGSFIQEAISNVINEWCAFLAQKLVISGSKQQDLPKT